jgi:thiol-disulfide isomerase/thioredoxin
MRGWLIALFALGACTASAKQPSLAELSGDVTVVAFWATWCAPCRHELPMVEALKQKLAGDARVHVVAVSVDSTHKAAKARKLASELGLTMPVIVDEALYTRFFGGDDVSVPRLAVIDRKQTGLQRNGARADETTEAFVKDVAAAVESLETGAAKPPSLMWQSFRPAN